MRLDALDRVTNVVLPDPHCRIARVRLKGSAQVWEIPAGPFDYLGAPMDGLSPSRLTMFAAH